MAKILTGKVVATKMKDTAVVQVSRRVPHPLYRKLLKKDQNFKVDIKEQKVSVGDLVKIIETKPISKDKHFKILEIVKGKSI